MKRFYFHLAFWLTYLLVEAYVEFAWISSSFAHLSGVERFLLALTEEFTLCLARIPLVYITFYIVREISVRQKKHFQAVVWLVISFLIFTLFHRVLQVFVILPRLYEESEIAPVFYPMRLIIAFLDLLMIAGVANALKLYRSQQQLQEQQKALTKEKLEAELHLLKAQTNPHFLFNTLNNIYALARKNSTQTAEVVMKLSKLLRFMLYESGKKSISIAAEVRVLEDYIELEKIRYNDRLTIDFVQDIDNQQEEITPLILLPFIENAFKHGTSETRFNTFIDIRLVLKKGRLIFEVNNSVDEELTPETKENMGLGNIRRQLELVYTDYSLEIEHQAPIFKVLLKIDLHSHVAL